MQTDAVVPDSEHCPPVTRPIGHVRRRASLQ
jgi:hypothetical protein